MRLGASCFVLAWVGCKAPEATPIAEGPPAKGFDEGDRPAAGSADYSVVDEFVHTVDPVDVLFVVDSSCSMIEEQEALDIGFPGFLGLLEVVGQEYHIGVITTDVENPGDGNMGQLRTYEGAKWVDASTADPFTTFSEMVKVGKKGSGNERGLDAVYMALDAEVDGYNAGFYREDAALLVMVLSDERDYSEIAPDTGAGGGGGFDITTFSDWFLGLKPTAPEGYLTFNALVGPPPAGCAEAERGDEYLAAVLQIGGVAGDICTPPYSDDLATMIGQVPTPAYVLSEEPVLDSLVGTAVEPDGRVMAFRAGDYIYNPEENSIRLRTAVADGSVLTWRYLPLSLVTP
jgi:hypothetical protein